MSRRRRVRLTAGRRGQAPMFHATRARRRFKPRAPSAVFALRDATNCERCSQFMPADTLVCFDPYGLLVHDNCVPLKPFDPL